MTKEEKKKLKELKAKIPKEERKQIEKAANLFVKKYGEAIIKLADE